MEILNIISNKSDFRHAASFFRGGKRRTTMNTDEVFLLNKILFKWSSPKTPCCLVQIYHLNEVDISENEWSKIDNSELVTTTCGCFGKLSSYIALVMRISASFVLPFYCILQCIRHNRIRTWLQKKC